MKRLLLMIAAMCMLQPATHAAMFVSGIVATNTTWTKANSPYIVNGNLSVDSGATLTIQPGVVVRVDSGVSFIVDGRLIAEGTVTDSILFTSNKSAPTNKAWKGIEFSVKSFTDSNKIVYCKFEHSRRAIYSQSSLISIRNTVLIHNMVGVHVHAPSSKYYKDYIRINKCLITQNDTGICNSGNAFINSEINENIISWNIIGMNEENASVGFRTFNYNDFNYNVVGYSATGEQFGCRLNTFKSNRQYGVYIANATPKNIGYVSMSLFLYNATAVYLDNVKGGNIYGNTFAYNNIGIDDYFTSTTFSGSRYRLASYNCYLGNSLYNIRENGSLNVEVYSEYFAGKTSTTAIDSTIYDFNDNSSNGKVQYNPPSTTNSCKTTSPPPACLQPDSLNIVVANTTTARATWKKIPTAPAYEYYIVPISAPAPASGVFTLDTFVNFSGLLAGQIYRVCVRAKCEASPFESGWVCDTMKIPNNISVSTPTSLPSIYPNPNKGSFVIDVPANIQSGEAVVMNVSGQVVAKQPYKQGNALKFDLQNAASGVYVLKMVSPSATTQTMFVVQ